MDLSVVILLHNGIDTPPESDPQPPTGWYRVIGSFLAGVLVLAAIFLLSPGSRSANAVLEGDNHFMNGELKRALDCYAKAAEFAPSRWRPHNRLARVFDKVGDFERARVHHEQALALGGEQPEVLICAANSAFVGKQYKRSQALLTRLLSIEPANFEALFLLSDVARAQGNEGLARLCLDKVLEHNPYHYGAHGRLALIEAEREPEKAVQSLLLCLDSGPPAGWELFSFVLLTQLHIRLGQPDKAREFAERLQRDYPKSEQARSVARMLEEL